jgi:zinc metalloprotease ZmpB
MTTASRAVASLPPGGQTIVGPFEWRPSETGHECMLMSASAPGDLANNDAASGLPAATGPTPLWRLVPCDNNLGLRAVVPVPGGGHREELVAAFRDRRFWACNPFAHTAKLEIRAVLPAFLTSRGWAVQLDNPGGDSFSLGPRDSRAILPRLISGQDFTALEVQAAAPVAIEFVVLADGLVVGGLTYLLEADMRKPAEERVRHDHEEPSHEEHQGEHRHEEERRGDYPHRIRVDIDLGFPDERGDDRA